METQKRVLARRTIKCSGCGAETIAARSDAHCPNCRKVNAQRHVQEYEARQRHLCPGCGKEIARSSVQCRACGQKARVQKLSRENSVHWKGGRARDGKGYVQLLVAPEARKGHRYQPEHRVLWEKANGPLPKGYIVHHINGIKDDNRLENLTATSRIDHTRGDKRIEHLEAELRRLKELKAKREAYWNS